MLLSDSCTLIRSLTARLQESFTLSSWQCQVWQRATAHRCRSANARLEAVKAGVCMQKRCHGSWMLQVPAWYLRYLDAVQAGLL
jgi:hypothetical protein